MNGCVAIRTSERGLALIRASEGLRLAAYRDTGGVWTIGYGHTRGVKRGHTCTHAVAEQWLREDVLEAEDTIRAYLHPDTIDAMPQAAWDALVSFVFNLGHQAFRNPGTGSMTGIARALEARDWNEVPAQMRRWVYDNGRRIEGLANRRDAEVALWRAGFKEVA